MSKQNTQSDLRFALGYHALPVPDKDEGVIMPLVLTFVIYQLSRFCLFIHDLIDNFAATLL